MEPLAQKFKLLIEDSSDILLTSHTSPDPDAVSSVLLMGTTLASNYPHKTIFMALEEAPDSLDFLEHYDQIHFGPLAEALAKQKPNLIIMLDGNNYERFSRHQGEEVRQFIRTNNVKTAIIDHHELAGADTVDVFMNQHSPSTVQDVYETCFNALRLTKPSGYAQTTMTGLYADTGGFTYMKDGQHKGLFNLAEELVEAGAKVELVRSNLSKFTSADMTALGVLIKNVAGKDGYSYSYLSDEFLSDWLSSGKTLAQLQKATGNFLDNYIRNIDGRPWGFIVYRNPLQGETMYSVSLRSAGDSRDVSAIAGSLGGGGHKPAAGAKFPASNLEEALDKVHQAIENTSVS